MEASDFTKHPETRSIVRDLKEALDFEDKAKRKNFSDIVDQSDCQYVDLVLEGGGVLGIALLGYTYILEEMGIRFLRIGGTSAGSINALLLAALDTMDKPKSKLVIEHLANLNLYEFVDGDQDARDFVRSYLQGSGKMKLIFKALQVLDNLEADLGLNPGKRFYDWLSDTLEKAGVPTTARLIEHMGRHSAVLRKRNKGQLTEAQKNAYLAIVTSDVTTETKVEFPKMAPIYWKDWEKRNPALYVRASMSIPYFFHPLRVDNIPQGEGAEKNWEQLAKYTGNLPTECVFVDGGIMSNFPINLFHKPYKEPSAPTFGVKLGTDRRAPRAIDSPLGLGGAMFDAARHCLDFDFIANNPDYEKLVTYIDTKEHNWLNFEMGDAEKVELFHKGARAASNFLLKFDWEAYKKIRRRIARAYVNGSVKIFNIG
jgi:NTE family protein